MSWLTRSLSSSVGKKLLMALSGLFFILFLTGHVIGNTQLFKLDDGEAFNKYALFMTTNPAIKILSYLTYFSIILHVAYSLLLTRQNKKARGNVRYAVTNKSHKTWSSANMALLGSLILFFLITHLAMYWAKMHGFWGQMPMVEYDGVEYKDLYALVVESYKSLPMVLFYEVSMLLVGFHLWHAFASAFQTLGLNHKKYTPFIQALGKGYTVVVCGLFAAMPLFIYFVVNA
ncbi:succinate dehydrogenase cytochrome b subunit [Sediminitomix flava]|uniref:Succinate dehydrogenase / fumarate reductase cytochrome b subunit n=1 Tax=Sediminitomix flava TaxID=379075 RepID=A0A315ZIK4_SEDFL|nr:succinate dehydrogenase cytochrome b subunit [Sediminitomix flava]PWJ44534.1 succinate dehydrogenase / fumarate reductase cytochrome b subunit [Sediminitomix flava]